MKRTIKNIHNAVRDDIEDLTTRRALPTDAIPHLDPFLFLNHHGPQMYAPNNHGLPFGPHPHRGFETVTFILDGDIAHRDSGGHESVIGKNGVQWMTAGRGLIHSETSSDEFKRQGGPLEILQLWVNLPSRLKMTDPQYIGLQESEMPLVSLQDGQIESLLVSGKIETPQGIVQGAFQPLTDIELMVLTLKTGAPVRFNVAKERSIFFYVVRGELTVNGSRAAEFQLVEFNHDGEEIEIKAEPRDDIRTVVLFGHGSATNEPIVAHGPFVMNTREEILQAIRDYQAGRFA